MKPRVLSLGLLVVASACGGTVAVDDQAVGSNQTNTGGQTSVGAALSLGGASLALGSYESSGGAITTGGKPATGGVKATTAATKATGGKTGAAGSTSMGGKTATAGSPALGGVTAVAGRAAIGGKTATAGSTAVGGWTATAGSAAIGGKTATAGSTATGGKTDAAGGTALGGKTATTGGAAIGGTSTTGGAANTGGITNTGGGSGAAIDPRPGAPCTTTADCQLMNDCCTCDVYSSAASPVTCDMECKISKCQSMGIGADEVACIAGHCVFSRGCDWSEVNCDRATPACPTGEIASVKDGCYGPCLPTSRCAAVSSCTDCTDQGLTCVTMDSLAGPAYHCVITPQNCGSERTCECMGVCADYQVCTELDPQTLACPCLTC